MKIKICTIFGKILTLDVEEQTKSYISGTDKFGAYIKILKSEIKKSIPID